MEAVPKLPMLSFELKLSSETAHFGPKLKMYISEAYREDPDSYGNEVHQLEGLRSTAVRPSIDSSGLNSLCRYFCQLRSLQSRFPMAKGQPAAVTFAWKDLYANMTCTLPDIRFEMACILYNIGALHTQLAASEPRNSADSMKAACTHYQNAAWAFMFLREHYTQPPGVDVSVDIMRLLQEICFAQAQECILEKSIQDTRKPSVVGAVATQVFLFYKNALAILGPSTGQDNIHEIIGTKLYNYWYRYLSFKMSYIGCLVCLYQGMHAEEQQKMGERAAFYQFALDKLNEARKLTKYIEPVQITTEALTFTNDVVEGKRKAAKNENEFIYHEEVPDKDVLQDLKPVCLVKALPINFNDPEVSGPDIFSRLVPMGAHEASSVYSEEKAKLLRSVVAQADSKNQELAEFMSSLQLDQLDVVDSDQKIPQEIVDRCAAMNAKPEVIQALVDSMNSLAEIISDVEHSLADIKAMIQEETAKEKEFQRVMGARPASLVQTEMARELHKYQEAHARISDSNQVLHKAMTLHIANLRLLAQPLDALQAKIPSIDNIEGLDRETMMEMKRVVGKAREMRAQRDTLIAQLREAIANDDITSQLLARSSEPKEDIFKQELEKHMPKVKIIEQNLAAQENIINKLTSLYASYGESRRMLSDVLRKREGLINALITSYDTHEELLGKSQKGLEFYRKMASNVGQLAARLRSTCQVQQEERAQLLDSHAAKVAAASSKADPGGASSTAGAGGKLSEAPPLPHSGTGSLKLKDYLPYMKNRGLARNVTPPQAHVEPVMPEQYYPESIYPTSVRPNPVGSEATDPSQMQLPDGVVRPSVSGQNPYNRMGQFGPNDADTYVATSVYGYQSMKPYDKPDDGYNYTSYTPQFSSQSNDHQYSNPYYSGTQNNTTLVTDSTNAPYNMQSMNQSQFNSSFPDPYSMHGHQMGTIPEAVSNMSVYNQPMQPPPQQTDLNVNFGQMQIAPKPDHSSYPEYSQNYYNQYPQTSTTPMATYSHAPQNSGTSLTTSQIPTENANTYPYTSEQQNYSQPGVSTAYSAPNTMNTGVTVTHTYPDQAVNPVSNAYNTPNPQFSYATSYDPVSQGYTIYTNAESVATSSTTVLNSQVTVPTPYDVDPAALAQLKAIDQPIKSHVTGEALSTPVNYQGYGTYDPNTLNFSNPEPASTPQPEYKSPEPNYQVPQNQPTNQNQFPGQNFQANYVFVDQTSTPNLTQSYQNHPGYTFNAGTGNYDYNYGSQTTYNIQSQINDPNNTGKDQNWAPQGVYTSAGICKTVQSPSENVPTPQLPMEQPNNQLYYNNPYGYQTITNQSSEIPQNSAPMPTNYGANVNQSTYMQSGQQNTNVTFTSNNQNQVSTPKENITEPPNYQQINGYEQQNENPPKVYTQIITVTQIIPKEEIKVEPVETTIKEEIKEEPVETKEPSAFDLLSDIDFSVEIPPLMPEIKVPPISETAIVKRPINLPKEEPELKLPPKEEVVERPAKKDLFSDPGLVNRFTEEVKNLQKLVDSLANKSVGGITVLDAKWKTFHEVQTKEYMAKSKRVAMKYTGNIVTEVVPYDDSRLTLKSNPDAYINASFYKQLSSWCIPLAISNIPSEIQYSIFWRAILENKISCVVCLLSEIEIQGKTYWPTAKGQTLELDDLKVTLEEVKCTVHWTERKLTVSTGNTVQNVSHYQINVFPAKIVCSPLVLLADKILSQTYDNRLSNQLTGALIQCAAGAGRSAVIALVIMVMCQVRAGYIDLCDMLDAGCINLCKNRYNVLEETKYIADAYRTALFYVQGVLCSGTTMFNGEAVAVPSASGSLPPPANHSQAPTQPTNQKQQKFSRESFEEMKQSPGLKTGDMKDPLNFLDPLWSLKKK